MLIDAMFACDMYQVYEINDDLMLLIVQWALNPANAPDLVRLCSCQCPRLDPPLFLPSTYKLYLTLWNVFSVTSHIYQAAVGFYAEGHLFSS